MTFDDQAIVTFVSHAPNFEDVLLWRAFAAVKGGFYVDCGAADPDEDSVTRAFYDRGWHGLNIPAAPIHQRPIEAARPRDITFMGALGAALRAIGPTRVHFMRLDLAGAEAQALLEIDLQALRPQILLVRAVDAGTRVATHADWEPSVLSAGFVFRWFDGISRFYVAEEHDAALGPCFASPPNRHDDFVRGRDSGLAVRLGAAEARAAVLAERIEATVASAREDTAAMMEMRVLNEHRVQQIGSLELALQREAARGQQAAEWFEAIQASSSWQATAPIRALLARLARRPPPADRVLPPTEALPCAIPPDAMPCTERALAPAGRPLDAVHQFHPGAARGDAVTNSMLLIQRILRDLGYVSEIYCDNPDPGLGRMVRPADQLPCHDGYVLLVHFSLGHERFDEIVALPAPKVLFYHNVTPPEFLTQAPVLQEFARLGARQLADWPGHVRAALAVSVFNALDLYQAGFPVVRTCPLLFDIDTLREAAGGLGGAARGDPRFTLLFVGRVVESKAQDDLVEAFALFRRDFESPCRLLLAGRNEASSQVFVARLQTRIAALGLGDDVVFTGFLDDASLHQCYRDADLYVSLSRHEGFGVPLVEAIAHGVPVLAWPCGAVSATLDDDDALLRDRAPFAVAARILAVARDPLLRQAIARRQSRGLERFRLDRHVPTLVAALMLAGAQPPRDRVVAEALDRTMRFAVSGHVNGSYSLAAVNRGLACSIEAIRPGRVRIIAVEGQETEDLSGVPAEAFAQVASLALRAAPDTGPEVVISQHYPVHVPRHRGAALLALFFWEESVVPRETVRILNRDFRGVLAPSRFVAKTLVDSGVHVPVHMIGQAPDLASFRRIGLERRSRPRPAITTFLHVSSCLQRKGVDVLLAAFARAFRATDGVRLVIKGYPNRHNGVPDQVLRLRTADPQVGEITLINEDLGREAFLDLYRQADVMVLPTRGEGFNLPAAEAMAARLSLIVSNFGGQADFCSAETARLLPGRMAVSRTHLASSGSLWFEPSEDALVAALRDARAAHLADEDLPRTDAAAARLQVMMGDAGLVERLSRAAADCILGAPPKPSRIGFLSTWQVRCGVADYTSHLISAWPASGASPEMVVFADERTDPRASGPARVRIAWQLGGGDNVKRLARCIAQEDPDVLIIQHQPGLLSWSELARLLREPAVSCRVVAVTLHNTGHLGDIAPAERGTILAALAGAGRVLVHGIADLERLRGWGLGDRAVLMPHGVMDMTALGRAGPLHEGPPLIGCYGFFLPGKGIAQLVAAVQLLRAQWPLLRLRLVNASYGSADSVAEIAACHEAVATAGLSDAVEWHTDFLSPARSRDLLAECDMVVLPYQSSRESSSAALRSVLSAGVAALVTPLAVFNDVGDAAARLDGLGPDAIARGVAAHLQDPAACKALRDRAAVWVAANAWSLVAERTEGLLLGLRQERRIRELPG